MFATENFKHQVKCLFPCIPYMKNKMQYRDIDRLYAVKNLEVCSSRNRTGVFSLYEVESAILSHGNVLQGEDFLI